MGGNAQDRAPNPCLGNNKQDGAGDQIGVHNSDAFCACNSGKRGQITDVGNAERQHAPPMRLWRHGKNPAIDKSPMNEKVIPAASRALKPIQFSLGKRLLPGLSCTAL
ncbi:hypothetical protein ABNC90_17795 [Paenibacillus larvae]|uniref:Uncharacterized protein n=1 Tax=Paenibacillus larvae TaxID=1464 RepID=A0AAP5JQ54_9BACL|nr:hypothetical protein [Paenibacillus larvae]MCY9690901.1 hypothetical protein [Paenibacillus larvae]MDR5597858.1 hypothetical protein [Paenibacillus larvae]MDT2250025.1 hypothetical protein [Paenibacillus larvae]